MAGWSDAQISQLIADHAALRDEVAALKGALQDCFEGWLKGNDVWGPMQRAGALLRKYYA